MRVGEGGCGGDDREGAGRGHHQASPQDDGRLAEIVLSRSRRPCQAPRRRGRKLAFAYSIAGLCMGYMYFSVPRSLLTLMAAPEKLEPRLEGGAFSGCIVAACGGRCHRAGYLLHHWRSGGFVTHSPTRTASAAPMPEQWMATLAKGCLSALKHPDIAQELSAQGG